jgi:uncharacterized Zn-finger protein
MLLFPWRGEAKSQTDEFASYETTKKLPDLHHAVDITLPEEWGTPRHLLLKSDRKLRCSTCHGLKDIEKIPYGQIDTKAREFLRGGPYTKLETFCFECHDRDEFERPNIHLMLDENGQLREDHCSYCHEEVLRERDHPLKPEEFKLRLPPDKLCYGCHLKTPHFNAVEHQSARPKDAMRRHLRESERRHRIILPLAANGKVMCPTCHTPHQYGVINAEKNPAGRQVHPADLKQGIRYREHSWDAVIRADKQERLVELNRQSKQQLELGYRRIEQEVLLRLPAKNGELCLACHEFEE